MFASGLITWATAPPGNGDVHFHRAIGEDLMGLALVYFVAPGGFLIGFGAHALPSAPPRRFGSAPAATGSTLTFAF
jgi:hypothetical protein